MGVTGFLKPKTIIVPGINSPFEAEIAVTAGLYASDDEDVKLGYSRGGNPFVRSGWFRNDSLALERPLEEVYLETFIANYGSPDFEKLHKEANEDTWIIPMIETVQAMGTVLRGFLDGHS